MATKIIADEPVLEALKEVYKEAEAYTGELKDGDRLIVYAHALVDGVTRRSEHGGLKSLEAILADPKTPRTLKVDVLGFLPKDRYGKRYDYLVKDCTIGYSRLPNVSLHNGGVGVRKRCDLSLKASESRLELTFSTERHKLKGLAAAIRIYLGALALGHADMGMACDLLSKAQERADEEAKKSSETVANIEVKTLLSMLHQHHKLVESWELAFRPERYTSKPSGDIWLVDDQCKTYLWEDVLKAIYGEDKVRAFETWEDMRDAMDQYEPAPDATVIVDCNLGETRLVGLDLLWPLRHRYPEVHVVMLSAFDDAQLALTALRSGADRYFVKQLADVHDRGSVAYYRAFREAIARPAQAPRDLWRRFSRENQPSWPKAPGGFDKQIRAAFNLAFLSVYPSNMVVGMAQSELPRAMVNILQAGWPDETGPQEWVPAICRKARHGQRVSPAEAMQVLGAVVDKSGGDALFNRDWESPGFPKQSVHDRGQYRVPGMSPGASADEERADHASLGRRGAIELAQGVLCNASCEHDLGSVTAVVGAHCFTRQTTGAPDGYRDVLAVDDDGERSGWFEALRVAFPGLQTLTDQQFNACPENDLRELLTGCNAVLLDLLMPAENDGLAALERITRLDVGLPVVTVSGANEVLGAERSLRAGAGDYITKAFMYKRGRERCVWDARRLTAQVRLARRIGTSPVRSWLQDAVAIAGAHKQQLVRALVSIYYTQLMHSEHERIIPVGDNRFPNASQRYPSAQKMRPLHGFRPGMGTTEIQHAVHLTAILAGTVIEGVARDTYRGTSIRDVVVRLQRAAAGSAQGNARASGPILNTYDARQAAIHTDAQWPPGIVKDLNGMQYMINAAVTAARLCSFTDRR